jgi:hypothetical protein
MMHRKNTLWRKKCAFFITVGAGFGRFPHSSAQELGQGPPAQDDGVEIEASLALGH